MVSSRRFLVVALIVVLGGPPSVIADATSSRETWYVVRIAGSTVGTASERRDEGAGGSRFQAHMDVRFTRLGTPISMMVLTEEVSGPDGRLRKARMESSVSNSSTSAVLSGDSVQFESHVSGGVDRRAIAWDPDAVPEVIATRRVTAWLQGAAPETTVTVFDIADGSFRTQRYVRRESTSETSGDGVIHLTRVEEYDDGATVPSSTIWFDPDGEAARTVVRQLGVEITLQRISLDELANVEIEPDFDIIRKSMVHCDGFPHPVAQVEDVTLRLEFAGDPPTDSMTGPNQLEVSRDGRALELRLTRETADVETLSTSKGEVYLRPDRFIQCGDPSLKAVADSLRAATNADGWPLARAVARWVNGYIVRKDMESGYASALDVYRSRSGDCTEHSLLTVAILRAAGIPARPVVGLAYGESEHAFVGHMWAEAYVDYWRTLDALDLDLDPIRLRVHAPESSESLGERDLLRAYGAVAGVSIRAVSFDLK